MSDPARLRAVRAAYDAVAVDYEKLLRAELEGKAFDRALLGTFAELVLAGGNAPVADVGCGPGRVAAHLASLGLRAFGVDLSPEMVAVARGSHPQLRFEVASMAELDLADGALGGIVAWYSIIHTPPDELPAVFAEFHRVLASGGCLLLAFQAGDACVHLEHAYGHAISLDAYRLSPETVSAQLAGAGFEMRAQAVREPEENEKTRQAYLLACKPCDVAVSHDVSVGG